MAALRGTKKIDMFVPARVDPDMPIESTVRYLVKLLREGNSTTSGFLSAVRTRCGVVTV